MHKSLQKQITYGKHIAENFNEFSDNKVYNAFIMPYNSEHGDRYKFVSVGTTDWDRYDSNTKNYLYVLGILVDTKWLITEYVKHNSTEIEHLANKIEDSLKEYKGHD